MYILDELKEAWYVNLPSEDFRIGCDLAKQFIQVDPSVVRHFVYGYLEAKRRTSMEIDQLREAFHKIASIENKTTGGEWDEIEEARFIANEALGKKEV